MFEIGGDDYSLSGIEKEILLGAAFEEKGWKEARVHFTVNCASVGCPPLRETIYTSDNIDELMTENTRLALNTDRRHLRVEGDTLHLTELFKWYEQDFVDEGGSVRGFISEWGIRLSLKRCNRRIPLSTSTTTGPSTALRISLNFNKKAPGSAGAVISLLAPLLL